jgi:hypothetical protein
VHLCMNSGLPLEYFTRKMNVLNLYTFVQLYGEGNKKMNKQAKKQLNPGAVN